MPSVSTGDVRAAWLHRVDDQWLRLRPHEERGLDAAARAGDTHVPLSGGRYEVRLWPRSDGIAPEFSGEYVSRYTEVPPSLIACSRWCFRYNGQWTPFAPADDEALEVRLLETVRLQAISPALETSSAVVVGTTSPGATTPLLTADGAYEVHFGKDGKGGVGVEMRAVSSSWLGKASPRELLFGSTCPICRGWAGKALPPLPEHQVRVDASTPSALVLVVHGIGEALWRKADNSLGMYMYMYMCMYMHRLSGARPTTLSV